jgi:hypothetical protein
MKDIEIAQRTLQQSIKSCVELHLTHFKTATSTFPKSITVELGPLVHVNNVEMPKVAIRVE